MRASGDRGHISGAERLVSGDLLQQTVLELAGRAVSKQTRPAEIVLTIEDLGITMPERLKSLELVVADATDVQTARSAAGRFLRKAGVTVAAAEHALGLLSSGPGPSGENMRGAMIIDASSGKRLEPDQSRGIRASRFDWTLPAGIRMRAQLAGQGLGHFRTHEALALATKIAHAPGVIAELCWSDDPDYTAGYVASVRTGYVRFPALKEYGNNKGGRAIFVENGCDVSTLVNYLETEAKLITDTDAESKGER